MLTKKQIKEIKEHLDKAQNPLFFFDNDVDGLCSFLLLQRYIGRGKGVAAKSYPDLTANYLRKVHELNSDYIFILDKPCVSKEFFDEVQKINIPVVWVDHHDTDSEIPGFVHYYNPLLNKPKKNEPTTYLCYQVSGKKEDSWLAIIGCIADKFIPDFYKEFEKKYPELGIESKDAFDILYKSQIGKIARMFSFALLDRTTNVVNMLRFLIKVKSPHEVLVEDKNNRSIHQRFREIDAKYQGLLNKAIEIGKNSGKLLFFKFGGNLSISADLANELSHLFPEKVIVVAYVTESKVNIGMRGMHVKKLILKAVKDFENSNAGGHENAVGAKIMVKDLEEFRKRLEKLVTRR